jgi:hypothetical protein
MRRDDEDTVQWASAPADDESDDDDDEDTETWVDRLDNY